MAARREGVSSGLPGTPNRTVDYDYDKDGRMTVLHNRLDKPFVKLEVDHYGKFGVEFGELPDGETLLDLLTLLEDN